MNGNTLAVGTLLAAVAVLSAITRHYIIQYSEAATLAAERQETITDMQRRQKDAALLDEKYIREQADAQRTIKNLESDVAAGRKRLRVAATCTQQSTAPGSLGDASSARLDDAAQRDYFTLRERITTVTGQVKYLQDYIRQQCLH
ncbi:hypothetical protein SY86_01470 [Erwinia tracheiphila]|uniref:Lysis protein n=1 Tax=Erwinia tracheiphila TaxID=65700 RepID=A0A0M2KDM5_9GAMM|nr:hypothetical protein ETR_23769 [Erwinia tracheiphila PSU-1]KKF34338.1 hypothetical protein SY86_25640 [Erwinia tracheiphila]KKF37054.1 hypothetical protein SY86_19070 [Erwinia tracheiphila]KKF37971.1 hypothetical protein SY86_01470 [Erwinia tracheiphila]